MDSEALIDIAHRLDNLEAQVRAIAAHLKIVLLYNPQKYEVVDEEKLKKETAVTISE